MFRVLALAILIGAPAAAQDTDVGFGAGGHDRSAPVEVAADNLTLNPDNGQAVLTGNVIIAQDDMRLSALKVVVDYSENATGDREIDRITAEGDVILVAGDDAAEGQRAVYRPGSAQIEMSGDVVVTQGGTTLAGDRMSVNLDSGAGRVTGRVRTTLQP